MDKWWKIFVALFPFLGTILQFFLNLKKRRIAIRSVEHEIGDLGRLFNCILKRPHKIFFFLLFLIWISAFLALVGGFLYLSLGISPNGKFWVDLPIEFFNQSLLIMIIYIALSVLAMSNIVSKVLLCLKSGRASQWRHDPGWINADWQLNYGFDFLPINIDNDACEAVANYLYREITREDIDYGKDRADYPRDLIDEELANYWLIGNTIEDEIHRLGKRREVKFFNVWDAVKEIAIHHDRPFRPENLLKSMKLGISFYPRIRELAGEKAGELPDEPKISVRLKDVIKMLGEDFQGDAHKLPKIWWKRHPSVKTLNLRLKKLGMSEGIAAQFIKLSKWSKLWPEMEVRPFSLPYSPHLARLLLNLSCIRVAPSMTTISVDENFRRLVRWTESQIIDSVEKYFKDLNDPKAIEFCNSKLNIKLEKLTHEDLVREVDYFLWSLADDKEGLFKEERKGPWQSKGRDRLIRE